MRELTVSLCFTESSLRYDVIHRGKFDIGTVGICGIKPHFYKDVLGTTNPNSLIAGSLILEHLLNKHNGDKFLALSEYKGAIYNYEPVLQVLDLEEKIRWKLAKNY